MNVCKKKHVTNMRAAGSDEALRLVPPKKTVPRRGFRIYS